MLQGCQSTSALRALARSALLRDGCSEDDRAVLKTLAGDEVERSSGSSGGNVVASVDALRVLHRHVAADRAGQGGSTLRAALRGSCLHFLPHGPGACGAAAPERPVDPKLAAARRARRERAQARAAERDYQRSVEELTEGERREAARGEMGGALQQASIGVNLIAAIVTAGFVGHYAGAQLSRTGPHVSQAPPPLLLVLLLLLLAADWHHLTPSHPRHLPVHARACQRWVGAIVCIVGMILVEVILFVIRDTASERRPMAQAMSARCSRATGDATDGRKAKED